jgi:hypothetical protein
MLRSLCLGLAVLLGVALEANGVFMLVSPEQWYFAVPGVTSTGPFNQHFLRDIGLIFLFPRRRLLGWRGPAAVARLPLGRSHDLAGRPCAVPLLGGGRRDLFRIGHPARFSCRYPASDHRCGAYLLGVSSLACRKSRNLLKTARLGTRAGNRRRRRPGTRMISRQGARR